MDDDYEDGDEDAEVKSEARDDDNEDLIKLRDEWKKKPATEKTDTGGPKPATNGMAKIKKKPTSWRWMKRSKKAKNQIL